MAVKTFSCLHGDKLHHVVAAVTTVEKWDEAVQSHPCELPSRRLELQDPRWPLGGGGGLGTRTTRNREEHLLASRQDRTGQGPGKQNLIIVVVVEEAQRKKNEKKNLPPSPPPPPHFQRNPIERLLDPVMIYKVTSQTDLL